MTRARIYLRAIPASPSEYHVEGWAGNSPLICHQDQIETVERGIVIVWSTLGDSGSGWKNKPPGIFAHRTFIPDANISLIEYEPCACPECVSAA